jgi:hypothetical protein
MQGGDIWSPKRTGERVRFSADLWNEWLRDGRGPAGPPRGEGVESVREGAILVQNNSGAPRGEFSILSLGDPVVVPAANLGQFKREILLSGVVVDKAKPGWCVLLDPLPAGAIGPAIAGGIVQVRVTGAGIFAQPIHGDTARLQAGDGGSGRILWDEGGDADRWAIVRFPEPMVSGAKVSTAQVSVTWAIGSAAINWTSGSTAYWDTDGYFTAAAPTVLTVPISGFYRGIVHVYVEAPGFNGPVLALLTIGGNQQSSPLFDHSPTVQNTAYLNVAVELKLNAGDQVMPYLTFLRAGVAVSVFLSTLSGNFSLSKM